MASLNVGLLADTSLQLSKLESVVTTANFTVTVSMVVRVESLVDLALPEVDVWIVRIDAEDERLQNYIDYLDTIEAPVIFDDVESGAGIAMEERARRLAKKVASNGFMLEDADQDEELSRATNVWVLAASAGGPEAVVDFIKHVPDDIDDAAFIYVQHMDEHMSDALIKTLRRNTNWQVYYCIKRSAILEKSIYLVSPSYQLDINETGTLNPSNIQWDGPYLPSVDQVVAKIWRKYKKDAGVIVFSGMGNDGAKNCRMIKNAGGKVWIQSPESCAVDSMPQEVLKTECVSYTGTPEQLARNFSFYQKKRAKEKEKRLLEEKLMREKMEKDSQNQDKEKNYE